MAKQQSGILGGYVGKVGTVVGYMWNGKYCMRAYKRYVKNPRSKAQTEHREMFKQEVQQAAKMRWAVTTTMTEMAREAGMTAYNLFVKVNQPAFGVDNGQLTIDYSRLVLSIGDVAQVQANEMEWSADNVLSVKFYRGCGSAFDHVYLYVYVPELEKGFLSAPTYRRDKRIAVALPDEFAGHEAHVYLMVQTADGRWSDSLYVGEIALNELVGTEEEPFDGQSIALADIPTETPAVAPTVAESAALSPQQPPEPEQPSSTPQLSLDFF